MGRVTSRIGEWARREAGDARFGRLLALQALGAAGDALMALALADSLYFSVPETDARARVALYLALTIAPFSVLAPLLSRVLDRHHAALRVTLVSASGGRALLAWWLATRLDSLYLFPLSFGLLVLSRATLITRAAALPSVAPPGRDLVSANASLSKAAAVGGTLAAPVGIGLLRWPGVEVELLVAAVIYALAVPPSITLPLPRRRARRGPRPKGRSSRPVDVRQALAAAGALRLLTGFLIFHLAFAMRREGLGSLGLGALVGSGALGSLLGALAAPRVRRRLTEEGVIAVFLGAAVVAAFAASRWFSVWSAGGLVVALGAAAGAVKLASDSIIQREVPEEARGSAFARSETALQLVWVAGALVPVLIPIPSAVGVILAGVASLAAMTVYMIGRYRVRQGTAR